MAETLRGSRFKLSYLTLQATRYAGLGHADCLWLDLGARTCRADFNRLAANGPIGREYIAQVQKSGTE